MDLPLASIPKLTRIQLAARICVSPRWPDIGQLADPTGQDPITRDWLVNHLPLDSITNDKAPSELLMEELARRQVKLDQFVYALDQIGRNDVSRWLHDRIERGYISRINPLVPETNRKLIKISDKIATVKNLIQSAPHVVTIHGEKGVGKSLLAEKFVRSSDYEYVLWLDCKEKSMNSSLIKLAKFLDVPAMHEQLSVRTDLDLIRERISRMSHVIIVFDNCYGPELVESLYRQFIPPDFDGHVLYTTSLKTTWPNTIGASHLELNYSADDVAEYFMEVLALENSTNNLAEIKTLVTKFQGYPMLQFVVPLFMKMFNLTATEFTQKYLTVHREGLDFDTCQLVNMIHKLDYKQQMMLRMLALTGGVSKKMISASLFYNSNLFVPNSSEFKSIDFKELISPALNLTLLKLTPDQCLEIEHDAVAKYLLDSMTGEEFERTMSAWLDVLTTNYHYNETKLFILHDLIDFCDRQLPAAVLAELRRTALENIGIFDNNANSMIIRRLAGLLASEGDVNGTILKVIHDFPSHQTVHKECTSVLGTNNFFTLVALFYDGLACLEKSEFQEALDIFERLSGSYLKEFSADYNDVINYYFGVAQMKCGIFNDARKKIEMVCASKYVRTYLKPFYCLGSVALLEGNFAEAKEYLNKELYEALKFNSLRNHNDKCLAALLLCDVKTPNTHRPRLLYPSRLSPDIALKKLHKSFKYRDAEQTPYHLIVNEEEFDVFALHSDGRAVRHNKTEHYIVAAKVDARFTVATFNGEIASQISA
jgi:tetratricopeptide (TPR) repeat protein